MFARGIGDLSPPRQKFPTVGVQDFLIAHQLALFREARFYAVYGLCHAAQLREWVVVMGYNSPRLSGYTCDEYLRAQASWEKLGFPPPDVSKDCCLFCAGDGCLFAVVPSFKCLGAVFKFCPSGG